MGIKNFFRNSKEFFGQQVALTELGPKQEEDLRPQLKVWIVDGMTVLTRLYFRLEKTRGAKNGFYLAFRNYILEVLDSHPSLCMLIFACDRSDRVTLMKKKTQAKRSRASASSKSHKEHLSQILREAPRVSISLSNHSVSAGQQGAEPSLVSSKRSADLSQTQGVPSSPNLDAFPQDLLHIRAHRKVLFAYLLSLLKRDVALQKCLSSRKKFCLVLDTGIVGGQTDVCEVMGPQKAPVWSVRDSGFWRGTEEGEADLTCWEWYSRLCSTPEGSSFLSAPVEESAVMIETIDTDLVLIGLLLTWQQRRLRLLGKTPRCFLLFTNRFTWDIRVLFSALTQPQPSERSERSADFPLLVFLWSHMTQGTDFCEKRDLSDRANFGRVVAAIRAAVPRHDALYQLRQRHQDLQERAARTKGTPHKAVQSPAADAMSWFMPHSFEEFLKMLCGFFLEGEWGENSLERKQIYRTDGLRLKYHCDALSKTKLNNKGEVTWSRMAPLCVLKSAYVTWKCSISYLFQRKDPLRCTQAMVRKWTTESSTWCPEESRREIEAQHETEALILKRKQSVLGRKITVAAASDPQSTKKKTYRVRVSKSTGWIKVKKKKTGFRAN